MIHYLKGDATEPLVEEGIRVIAHVCNDEGKWGAGFSGAVSAKWKDPEKHYRSRYRYARHSVVGGAVQWVFIHPYLAVTNMIAQKGVRSPLFPKPIRYDWLEECLSNLAEGCRALEARKSIPNRELSIHMPKIGTGLAGGEWSKIEPLIEAALWDLEVYVYEFEG